ncbi:hypothetical protein ACP70R_026301 [Stipagrostis hirtigluma subsp. patula]
MLLAGELTARSVRLLVTVLVLCASAPACRATHNVTAILSGRRDLAEFSRALTATGLADDINGRNTLTVLAVDDAHMAPLKARNLPREALRHVLSLHVLVDYYDDAKLHRLPGGSADVSTLFQASGDAPGSAGMVKIAERRGGRVAFLPQDEDEDGDDAQKDTVFYVKPVQEEPYNISVLQVSGVISSPAAEAAASPESRPSLSDVMSKNGCGRFAGLVAATTGAAAAYDKSAGDGLTVFCPADKAVEAFEPTLKKMKADSQLKLVLYHGVPAHYSMQELKAKDGDMSTLATDRDAHYSLVVDSDGGKVALRSAARKAAVVVRTLTDAEHLAVHMIDAVLQPNASAGAPTPPISGPSDGKDGGGDGHQKGGASGSSCPFILLAVLGWFVIYL